MTFLTTENHTATVTNRTAPPGHPPSFVSYWTTLLLLHQLPLQLHLRRLNPRLLGCYRTPHICEWQNNGDEI